jgi:hypothetical protein
MYGSIVNRICENSKPMTPVVGEYATSYLYTDRNVHYIVKVEKDGKIFWTKDVGRCVNRPEFTATFKTDEKGNIRITVTGNDLFNRDDLKKTTYVDNKLFLPNQVEEDVWLYLNYDEEGVGLDRWVLLKDGKYHESRYDRLTGKYRNSIKNTTTVPGRYDYYYDPSF